MEKSISVARKRKFVQLDTRSYSFHVVLPNGVSVIVKLERSRDAVVSVQEFKTLVRAENEYVRKSMGVTSVKNRRKIFWCSPNLCFKYHGLKLFKLFLCLFEHEKMHNLILDDGQISIGMGDLEIPRFCPGPAIQGRLGTVILGLPLSRGRIAFGSDTRCTYKNGSLVVLDSWVEYQSPKLLRVDANCSMATCGDETYNLKVHRQVANKAMTEMRTADGLANLVEETMRTYYRKSINSGIFLGVIEDGKTRFFHHKTYSGHPNLLTQCGNVMGLWK